jgi:enoyl-CoA hydratase/carnithine racemase
LSSETVLWQQDGPIGRITLNRPDTLNAWIAEFGQALKDIVERESRPHHRCRARLL